MNVTTAKRITLATFKAFIRKNSDRLFIMHHSHFDGMTDGIEYARDPEFIPVPAESVSIVQPRSYGIQGAWLVGGSRDYFQPFSNDEFTGITAWNCCGEFTLAVKK